MFICLQVSQSGQNSHLDIMLLKDDQNYITIIYLRYSLTKVDASERDKWIFVQQQSVCTIPTVRGLTTEAKHVLRNLLSLHGVLAEL